MIKAVEIGKMIVDGPKRLLDMRESSDLATIVIATRTMDEAQRMDLYHSCLKQSPGLQIMHGRMQQCIPDAKVELALIILMSGWVNTPGSLVLLVAVLAHLKAQNVPLTIDGVVAGIFGNGIPNEENLKVAWDAQKGAPYMGGNWLDSMEAWL